MSLLLINTLPPEDQAAQAAINALTAGREDYRVINTAELRISPCLGCNDCWLVTPGICRIKDDYQQLLQRYLHYDDLVFIGATALGFIDYRLKNVIDRVLPVFTMHLFFRDGQMRHVPRYDRSWRIALLYAGAAEQDHLQQWLQRFCVNMLSESLGVYPIEQAKEAAQCIC